ncbi:hypothetical protein QYE76_021319 [Lolium multiflorum]|uniref:DUF4283 domain-containing protein n=1 Tax=Lolium multiflorum TaxID=4521 RepID=A0AAD8R7H1_LOLMU|nr:hypothetical protein QYE76_021319 [Lolium multiflorum]
MGDFALPPPPPPYKSPAERRKAARESRRATRRAGKEGERSIRPRYEEGEGVGDGIKPKPWEGSDRNFSTPPSIRSVVTPERGKDRLFPSTMAPPGASRTASSAGSSQGGRHNGHGTAGPMPQGIGASAQFRRERAQTRAIGLLMPPPVGGGDQGGLVERPTRPKPTGGASAAPLLRRQALLEADAPMKEDGNWDEGEELAGMGFNQGDASKIGGIVDMEDDVYLEFDEDEPVKEEPKEQSTWQILARYMANFKPNTRAMFNRFIDEVWHLRNGISYSEKGKNYYGITLFSKGDYDFVMRGGPWIFNQNALLGTDLEESAQPSETKLDSVPVWVRIYDVPWGKQDENWGMKYGNGLGKAMEVDVPASEQEKKDFLRVRVRLPYDRRLQTQITTGVKGKPREVKVFKLKYERVPYYCSHCGFMGHKKDACEKMRLGLPSLDYDAHELRCSPYKKFEHRTYYAPPAGQASAKRNLSFASFGNAESYKRFDQRKSREQPQYTIPERVNSQSGSANNDDRPPLMDDPAMMGDDLANVTANVTVAECVNEAAGSVQQEVEENLAERVDAILMDTRQTNNQYVTPTGRDASQPIIQFPEEEVQGTAEQGGHIQVTMTRDMLAKLQKVQAQSQQEANSGRGSWEYGPRPSDMIPALQGLSSLQVSFGSVNDISMPPADTILGKRAADDQEVQGGRLELSLGLDYGSKRNGATPKKGKTQELEKTQGRSRVVDVYYQRQKKLAATGHKPADNLTRPNVWSRVPYTYDNKCNGRANVRVRLDRAVACPEWRDRFADTRVQHLTSPVSDHCPVLVELVQERSRVSWLKEGDRNTRFFHQKAVWRARKNKVKKLKDDDGVWKEVPTDMERMATTYFQELFTRDPSLNSEALLAMTQAKVTTEMNYDLYITKGKMVVDTSQGFKRVPTHADGRQKERKRWVLPDQGVAKLNIDGAYASDGAVVQLLVRPFFARREVQASRCTLWEIIIEIM